MDSPHSDFEGFLEEPEEPEDHPSGYEPNDVDLPSAQNGLNGGSDRVEPYRRPRALDIYFRELKSHPLLGAQQMDVARAVQDARETFFYLSFSRVPLSSGKFKGAYAYLYDLERKLIGEQLDPDEVLYTEDENSPLPSFYHTMDQLHRLEGEIHTAGLGGPKETEYFQQGVGLVRSLPLLAQCLEEIANSIKADQNLEPLHRREQFCQQITDAKRRYIKLSSHFVESNLRLVIYFAKRYQGRGVPLEDLIQEGNLGLMKAVEKFDPERGLKLSTYAQYWIRQKIGQAIGNHGKTVRLPPNVGRYLDRLHKVQHTVYTLTGSFPTPEELAERTDLPLSTIHKMLLVSTRTVSLDAPLFDDGTATVGDNIPDSSENPDSRVETKELRIATEQMLEKLSSREREILERRFGFNGHRPRTLREIGEELNITRERVRQIQDQVLERLRRGKQARALLSYLES